MHRSNTPFQPDPTPSHPPPSRRPTVHARFVNTSRPLPADRKPMPARQSSAASHRTTPTPHETIMPAPSPPPLQPPARPLQPKQHHNQKPDTMLRILDTDDGLMRSVSRGTPGEVARPEKRPKSRQELARKRSNYFEEAFQAKGAVVSAARESVRAEAMVMAEVKTNVIINDEFTFLKELSDYLAERYHRPVSSIAVTLQHGACMLYAGTFDPAYIMTVTALTCEIQATVNRRNASLIQRHMHEALGVAPARGILRFVPLAEENAAWGGNTVAGEVAEAEKRDSAKAVGSASSTGGSSPEDERGGGIYPESGAKARRLSVMSFSAFKSVPSRTVSSPTPPSSGDLAPARVHSTRERQPRVRPRNPAQQQRATTPALPDEHQSPQHGSMPTGQPHIERPRTAMPFVDARDGDEAADDNVKHRRSFVSALFRRPSSRRHSSGTSLGRFRSAGGAEE